MNGHLTKIEPTPGEPALYPFMRNQFMFKHKGVSLMIIDLVVYAGDQPPVNDFDVNRLTYNGEYYDKTLIEKIKKNEADMYESYASSLVHGKRNHKLVHVQRVNRCFIDKGWTLTAPLGYKIEMSDNKFIGVSRVQLEIPKVAVTAVDKAADNVVIGKYSIIAGASNTKDNDIIERFDSTVAALRSVIVDLLKMTKKEEPIVLN